MVGVAVYAQARLALQSSLQRSGGRCAICRSVLYLLEICALSSRTNSASSVLKQFARDNNIDSSNRLFCFRSPSKDGIGRKSESTKCDVIALMPSAFALRKISLTNCSGKKLESHAGPVVTGPSPNGAAFARLSIISLIQGSRTFLSSSTEFYFSTHKVGQQLMQRRPEDAVAKWQSLLRLYQQ
jgi:hypothetical protein